MASHAIFEKRRGDVLPCSGDDYLLLSACDRQETLIVENTDIAGAEPIIHEGFAGCLVVVPVPREHMTALDEDFTVLVDADRSSLDWQPDRSDPDRIGAVHRCSSCGLRQSVTLQRNDTYAPEEMPQSCTKWRSARDGVLAFASEQSSDPRVDDLVESRVSDLRSNGDLATFDSLGVRDGCVSRSVEDPALATSLSLRLGTVVDLLEDTRYGEHPCRLDHRKLFEKVRDPGAVRDRDTVRNARRLHYSGKDVRERKEHQRLVAF